MQFFLEAHEKECQVQKDELQNTLADVGTSKMVYFSLFSNSVQYVRLHPILMSILLYHYKQLTACISEIERIQAKVNRNKKTEWLTKKKEVSAIEIRIRYLIDFIIVKVLVRPFICSNYNKLIG